VFSSVLSQFKKYYLSGNLIFYYLGIFQSLKLRILKEKILSIHLKQNFTPNTWGRYGLKLFFSYLTFSVETQKSLNPLFSRSRQQIFKHLLPCIVEVYCQNTGHGTRFLPEGFRSVVASACHRSVQY